VSRLRIKVVCCDTTERITEQAKQAVAEVVQACNGALKELEKCQVELIELEKTTIEFNNQDYVKNVQNEVQQILINTVQTRDRWSKVTLQAKEGEEDQQKPQ